MAMIHGMFVLFDPDCRKIIPSADQAAIIAYMLL